ncbi:MAG: dockerin type I domain-containing protein [Ruminococcus flavefaciens]|nr:dockerin type I domain-containing protein [Ruminococcus flavefaciens]MCM1234313.1 dockerin type I domain-containing protein [Ruminococcus flavefaciens]
MKSYEDIAERVFRKGDEILRKRQKRTAFIRRTSFALSGVCAVVLVGIGIWKSDNIKNPFSHFPQPDSIIEQTTAESSCSETGTSAETATTRIISKATTVSSTASAVICTTVSNPPVSAGILSTSAELTDITAQTSLTQTAPAQTELTETGIYETSQTTVGTAVATDFTQTTISSADTDEEEGGNYMKKLTSFFTSAVVLAASASPVIGHAEFNVDTSRLWSGEKAMFEKMDNGELEIDIDGNGTVDVLDGYLLDCYTYSKISSTDLGLNIPDEMTSRIEAIADYNGDGKVDIDDSTSWIRHFIVNHGLEAEVFNYDNYESEYIQMNSDVTPKVKAHFTSNVCNNMKYLKAGYELVNDMCEKGIINLDANGNGQIDIGDAMNFYVYQHTGRGVMAFPSLSFVDVENNYIPQEEWDYCDEVFKTYEEFIKNGNDYSFSYFYFDVNLDCFIDDVMCYIVNNIELKSEYFNEEYYAETFGERYYRSPYTTIISYRIKNATGALGLKADENAWIKFDKDEMNDFFTSYCNDVENGLRPAPDVNTDGIVDYYDYFDSNIYFNDLLNDRTAEDSILPEETWNNLAENFDINGNGTSKDVCDIMTIQLYVVKYAESPEDFNKAYNEYVESLGADDVADTEVLSYENNVKILADFREANTVYGDANEDGVVDIADAAAIIQYLGNKDRHALSEQGRINADCCNTGDGVTGMDALAIQKLRANLVEALPCSE